MKHLKHFLICSFVFLGLSNLTAQPVKIWETKEVFKGPESAAYDSERNLLYVSNYTSPLRPGTFYGDACISKVSLDGEIIKYDWIKNITTPTGICIFKNKLYIVERFGVVEYDLTADSISNKYYIKTGNFLNDITVDSDTNIYVSESDTDVIYKIKNNTVEKWLVSEKISRTNGILADGNKLIAGVIGDSCVKAIDLSTKDITEIAHLKTGIIDGIKKCGNNYLVSHFEGNLYLISPDGGVEELMNTRNEKSFIADFEYIEDKDLLIVPSLWNNKLAAYKYKYAE